MVKMPRQQRATRLHAEFKWSINRIARALGITPSAAGKLVRRGKRTTGEQFARQRAGPLRRRIKPISLSIVKTY